MRTFALALGCALTLSACAAKDESTRAPQGASDGFYNSLDDEAHLIASAALQTALETFPSGNAHFWSAPSGAGGSITPLRTVREASGRYCRDFREIIILPGAPRLERQARACRNASRVRWSPT